VEFIFPIHPCIFWVSTSFLTQEKYAILCTKEEEKQKKPKNGAEFNRFVKCLTITCRIVSGNPQKYWGFEEPL